MAYVAGTYTASELEKVVLKEGEFLTTSRQSELSQPIVAGQAILSNMDPNIQGIQFMGEECIKAKITNIRLASTLAADKTYTCETTGGIEAGTDSKDLSKTILTKPSRFKIWDHECHNAFDFTDRLAYMSLKAKIDQELELTRVLVEMLQTNADVPDPAWFTSTTVTPVVDNTTELEIATADWNGSLLAEFLAIKTLADMPNAIILSGRNLFNKTVLAQFESQYASTNNQVLVGQNFFDIYFDLKNVDQTTGLKSTFMVDKNALIFWSSPLHKESMVPELVKSDTYRWTDTLPRLQYMANGRMNPIYIDVKASRICTSGAYGWEYEYILRGALDTNLPNQNGDYGILHFSNVTTPAA